MAPHSPLSVLVVCRFAFAARVSAQETAARTPSLDQTKISAEKGDADAQFNLGVAYSSGKGVPKDETEAIKWYRKAAEQNHTRAQF
jgi:TPR repeat protein